jgi:hypothetical protein
MTDRPPQLSDPKQIWQNQEMEKTKMSVEEIRRKAQRFLAKSRFDNAVHLVFALIVVGFCAVAFFAARATAARVIAAVVMMMLLVRVVRTLYFSYRKYGRLRPDTTRAGDAALTTCLEFYRNELERQRVIHREPAWQLAITFLVIGWLTRDAMLRSRADVIGLAVPFDLFSAAGFVVLLAVRKFQMRRVQAELDALDKFEQEDS